MSQAAELATREERKPFVRFERVPVEDVAASLAAKRYVAKDVDYVLVTPPYSKDVFKQKVSSWLFQLKIDESNGRIPSAWLNDWRKMYEAFQNGQEMPLSGTPIRGWGIISPAMQETLTRMNILTVESLAAINGEGMDRIGMGAVDLKNKATAWLAQLNDAGKMTMEMSAVQRENTILKASVESLQRQVEQLMRNQPAQNDVQVDVPRESIGAADILDEPDLSAQYEAKFGKKPHHLMKQETIAAKLAE
jgi:hypothetical protein